MSSDLSIFVKPPSPPSLPIVDVRFGRGSLRLLLVTSKQAAQVRLVRLRLFLSWAQVKELVASSLMALDRFSPDPELSEPAIAGMTGVISDQDSQPRLVRFQCSNPWKSHMLC